MASYLTSSFYQSDLESDIVVDEEHYKHYVYHIRTNVWPVEQVL
jgi:hypothetical protein